MGKEKDTAVATATRKSIKKIFPLGSIMCKGTNNPITLHSVDDEIFVRIWSLIAETLVVTVELSRHTKEAIATMVSERNDCPVCINAHCVIGHAAERANNEEFRRDLERQDSENTLERDRKRHQQAIKYAGYVFDVMTYRTGAHKLTPLGKPSKSKRFHRLSDVAKAECTLVVMTFLHINRVVSAILGKEMSTAMFSVPRAAAILMEKKSVVKAMSKVMSPFLSSKIKAVQKVGVTVCLFSEEENGVKKPLPDTLKWVLFAGLERGNALSRIHQWTNDCETKTLLEEKVVSEQLIRFLEEEVCNSYMEPAEVLDWAKHSLPSLMDEWVDLDDPKSRAIIWVLALATQLRRLSIQSPYWYTLVELTGEKMARLLLVWWSLRYTLRCAKFLEYDIDADGMAKHMMKQQMMTW